MKFLSAAEALLLLEFPLLSFGYTWQFKQTPTQCGQLTISIGSGGKPPYTVLILPSGPTPFSNGTEVRRILEQKSDSSDITFQLKYPSNTQFVAVVSDSSGFGSGGVSAAAQVISSSDNSCFDASQPVTPPWTFNIFPLNQIVQCQDTRLWWDPTKVQGNVSFLGVIPAGQAFQIPQGTITDGSSNGTGLGFTWKPNIRSGTPLHIVASDGRGTGSGGSSRITVGDNPSNDLSCLNDTSPSATAGNPAGGSYPTDSNGNGVNGGSNSNGGSNTNVGAIVGGVIGGVFGLIAVVLVILFFRRRGRGRRSNEKPVDLLNADEGDESNRRQELPQYYEPEPFLMPDPTVAGSDRDWSSEGRPLSGSYSDRPSSRSGTPDVATTSVGTRKTAPRQFRAVNIIQHDDAGPSEQKPPGGEEPDTIELPPAYTNIRQ
ncbi:hypothetical protein L218DRAFT_1072400 [Marasmius fiardii PR-910]|nr:hypothetical protein L218DRAFT_1072400 [Marasmius fiardii PR-910]